MGRPPCCDELGLKKGPWTPEEDQKLLAYIQEHGHGNWRALPSRAGLQRCGKSCRLRWTNYLRPDIKRGKFNLHEEQTIIQLHALLGNRWSAIATCLPKRTDNEIKNYWNTHLKKRLTKMGIDPVTHKPKNDALVLAIEGGLHQSKNVASLSHMAQWESARLEAEARLVRQSKLPSSASSSLSSAHHSSWPSNTNPTNEGIRIGIEICSIDMDSPTSTLSFKGSGGVIEFMRHNNTTTNNDTNNHNANYDNQDNNGHQGIIKKEGDKQVWNPLSSFNEILLPIEANNNKEDGADDEDDSSEEHGNRSFVKGFTELLLSTSTTATTRTSSSSGKSIQEDQSTYISGTRGTTSTSANESDYYEDNDNYWNSILNLADSSPLHSSMF